MVLQELLSGSTRAVLGFYARACAHTVSVCVCVRASIRTK